MSMVVLQTMCDYGYIVIRDHLGCANQVIVSFEPYSSQHVSIRTMPGLKTLNNSSWLHNIQFHRGWEHIPHHVSAHSFSMSKKFKFKL